MKNRQFLRALLTDVGSMCNISTDLDYNYIEARMESEGDEFLSVTLPQFASDLERALSMSVVTPDLFAGFRRKGKLPIFLGGFMELIFLRSSGVLIDIDDTRMQANAIKAIRQVCISFKKVEKECSPERFTRAFQKYIDCENEISRADAILQKTPALMARFELMANRLFGGVFSVVDNRLFQPEDNGYILPKHGPGSTAERLLGNRKFTQTEWPERLDYVFPYGEYVQPIWRSPDCIETELVPDFIEPANERPVRVVGVPKTQLTPRIIAIEPTAMQYMQQGIMEVIFETVSSDYILRNMIGFHTQIPNQELAKEGSLSGRFATLDLSEASDRVSCLHVELLLKRHPLAREAIFACRSTTADVPGHGVIPLAKFASMGSALTFPLEAMIFLTLVFVGIEEALNTTLSRLALRDWVGMVRVFGDDIIVPEEFVTPVIEALESFGYRVNLSKSFWKGNFRESCGKEYWRGHDVSVVKVRTDFPTSRGQAGEIVSTVELRNLLFLEGMATTVELLDGWISAIIPFPFVTERSPILGRLSYDGHYDVTKWDKSTQRPLVKGVVVRIADRSNEIDGEPALMKFFLKRGDLPFFAKNHLLFGGRAVSVSLMTRLASPI